MDNVSIYIEKQKGKYSLEDLDSAGNLAQEVTNESLEKNHGGAYCELIDGELYVRGYEGDEDIQTIAENMFIYAFQGHLSHVMPIS